MRNVIMVLVFTTSLFGCSQGAPQTGTESPQAEVKADVKSEARVEVKAESKEIEHVSPSPSEPLPPPVQPVAPPVIPVPEKGSFGSDAKKGTGGLSQPSIAPRTVPTLK